MTVHMSSRQRDLCHDMGLLTPFVSALHTTETNRLTLAKEHGGTQVET